MSSNQSTNPNLNKYLRSNWRRRKFRLDSFWFENMGREIDLLDNVRYDDVLNVIHPDSDEDKGLGFRRERF